MRAIAIGLLFRPVGFGKQRLYEMTASFGDSSVTDAFGIRTFRFDEAAYRPMFDRALEQGVNTVGRICFGTTSDRAVVADNFLLLEAGESRRVRVTGGKVCSAGALNAVQVDLLLQAKEEMSVVEIKRRKQVQGGRHGRGNEDLTARRQERAKT